jgi:hypothetical protein
VLQLIYDDLSARAVSREITLENFILFFHKNGLWGERLFHEFDSADDKQINEQEFIIGIGKFWETQRVSGRGRSERRFACCSSSSASSAALSTRASTSLSS